MLWLKALHVVFVVTWFAGLFYLPRLFVYHALTTDAPGLARFIVMERRLYFIMSLGALLALLFGIAMLVAAPAYLAMGWLRAKVLLVALLVGYHVWCYHLMHARSALVAIQAESDTVAANGKKYQNRYHFYFRFEGDRIALVREYNDTNHVREVFMA